MNVIDFAIEVERREQRFLRQIAQHSDRPDLQALFQRLSEEEGASVRNFEGMREPGAENEDSPQLTALLTTIKSRLDPGPILGASDEVDAYRRLTETERGICRLVREAAGQEVNEKSARQLAQVAGLECRQSEEMETLFDFVNAPNEFLAWAEFSNIDEFHNFGRYVGVTRILPDREILH